MEEDAESGVRSALASSGAEIRPPIWPAAAEIQTLFQPTFRANFTAAHLAGGGRNSNTFPANIPGRLSAVFRRFFDDFSAIFRRFFDDFSMHEGLLVFDLIDDEHFH